MGCGKLKVECEDGFQVISKDAHELVHMVQTHVKNMHHKAVSESDVMAMAKHP
jgi:predicted small metal-binding protein